MKNITTAFGGLPMTWPVVAAFAAIIGIYVGVINQIPILYDTSFRDIAVSYEWWVLFAVLIVSNCKNAKEAGLKCLVFFLISQPVIFLVELPSIGLDKALYYYTKIWLPITLLTLPGGAIAFYAKKQNALGAVALSIGNTVVALLGVSYFQKLCHSFPRHLLTVVSCAAIIAVLLMGMQQKWKTRFLSAATTLLLTAGVIIWAVLNERVI